MQAPSAAHPSDSVLQALALGILDEAKVDSVMEHLQECSGCRSVVIGQASDDFLALVREAHEASGRHSQTRAGNGRHGDETMQQGIHPTPPDLAGNPQYEILRELGRGGMGVVYLVHNRFLAREEVIKVINQAVLVRAGGKERFLREIQLAARLNHPNVVTAYAALPLGEGLAFAMEYVKGQDLAKVVKTHGPLPVANACHYARQVALGLSHAHAKHMVHRDIKPQNLILTREGKRHIVKILDFGLAKVLCEQAEDSHLTLPGKALGTPDYIAPEQSLDASRADIRADLYSLGCTLYFLLAGRPPYRGKNPFATMQAHHLENAQPLHLVRQDVPQDLDAIVARLMAKSPGERFQTPDEVAQALLPFIRSDVPVLPETGVHGATNSAASWFTPEKALGELRALVGTRLTRSPALLGLGLAAMVMIVLGVLLFGRSYLESTEHVKETAHSGPEPAPIIEPPPVLPEPEERIKPLLDACSTTVAAAANWGGAEWILLQGELVCFPERLTGWLKDVVPTAKLEKEPLPVPDPATIEGARERIRAEYQIASARPGDRSKLARRLLDNVSSGRQSAERYAMLDEARDLAANAPNMELAAQVIQEMAKRFQINTLHQTARALERTGMAIDAKSGVNIDLAHRTLDTIGQAVEVDDYETAMSLLSLATKSAKRARDPKAISDCQDLKEKLPIMKVAHTSLTKILAEPPNEPTRNEAVGRFLCFFKQDWEKGLPLLAQGNDATLRRLALHELQGAQNAAAWVELGDGWNKFSQRADKATKLPAKRKAYFCYRPVRYELEGMVKSRVEKFMNDMESKYPKLKQPWDHLDISQAEVHREELVVMPGKSLATKREYTGPLWITLSLKSDSNSLQLAANHGPVLAIQGSEIVLGKHSKKLPKPAITPGRLFKITLLLNESGMAVQLDRTALSQPQEMDLSRKAHVRFFSGESLANVQSFEVSSAQAGIPIPALLVPEDELNPRSPILLRPNWYFQRGGLPVRPGQGGGAPQPGQGQGKGQNNPSGS